MTSVSAMGVAVHSSEMRGPLSVSIAAGQDLRGCSFQLLYGERDRGAERRWFCHVMQPRIQDPGTR